MWDAAGCLAPASRWGIPQQDAATLRLTAAMLGKALLGLPAARAGGPAVGDADAARPPRSDRLTAASSYDAALTLCPDHSVGLVKPEGRLDRPDSSEERRSLIRIDMLGQEQRGRQPQRPWQARAVGWAQLGKPECWC